MSKPSPARPLRRPDEQFDMNAASAAGTIQKIWGRGGDVFARLRVSLRGQVVETEDAQSCYVTLRFSGGTVQGQDLSLQAGDVVQVAGYLTHTEFEETLRKFLEAAGEPGFLDGLPPDDRPGWQAIAFKRVNTMFNVEELTLLEADGRLAGQATGINRVVVEGIVARAWTHSEDRYLRLAVYDRHTPVTQGRGNYGRPRRKPHYVTILLPAGKTTGGREVAARLKDRLRVTGALRDRGYRQTLHEALLRTGSSAVVELMQRLPNAERMQEIAAQQETTHLEAAAVIVYASAKRKTPNED